MNQYNELKQVLQAHLPWHGARLSFLAMFLLALLKVRTVNLSQLCLGFGGRALPASSYKRLQRFFRGFNLDPAQLAHLVVSWLHIQGDWVLSWDRTTWKCGHQWHNILTLGIVHKGVAIPVLRLVLMMCSKPIDYAGELKPCLASSKPVGSVWNQLTSRMGSV